MTAIIVHLWERATRHIELTLRCTRHHNAYRPMLVASWEEWEDCSTPAVEHCSGAALLAAAVAVGDPTLLGPPSIATKIINNMQLIAREPEP